MGLAWMIAFCCATESFAYAANGTGEEKATSMRPPPAVRVEFTEDADEPPAGFDAEAKPLFFDAPNRC